MKIKTMYILALATKREKKKNWELFPTDVCEKSTI